MNKERGTVLSRILVSIGIFLFLLNFVFYYLQYPNENLQIIILISILIQIALGIVISAFALEMTKKAYQFFIGLLLSGWGILSGLITFVLPYDDGYWWPLYLVIAGIFVFISGIVKYRKIKFGYIIPSLTLFIMGIWFALFSFKIVKVSFRSVVFLLGPAFIVLIAISLIFVFLIQQRHKKLIVNDDDFGDFDDEDLSFPKLD